MHNSILATTYTDTAPLCGTYPKTCIIRYFAKPARIDNMHEIGLRILIAKINIIAAMYEKIYLPLISFSKRHYFRLFGKVKKASKENIKKHLENMGCILYCKKCMERKFSCFNLKKTQKCSCGEIYEFSGPLWTGNINDADFCSKIIPYAKEEKIKKFIEILKEESMAKGICYSIHELAKKTKKNVLNR